MDCRISVSARDQGTEFIADALDPCLEKLSRALSEDYGGALENLWIDLDLCPAHADDGPARPFRFQTVVAPPRDLAGLGLTKALNVGHYSVMPDYAHLATVPREHVVCYLLPLIYDSTVVLKGKSRRLGGFDADAFRADFLRAMAQLLCQRHSQAYLPPHP